MLNKILSLLSTLFELGSLTVGFYWLVQSDNFEVPIAEQRSYAQWAAVAILLAVLTVVMRDFINRHF